MKNIALITWASSWLGVDFAKQLSQQGYHCVLVARDEKRLQEVQVEIDAAGGSADIYIADLSDSDACERLATYVRDRYPHIDVLINNAWFGAYGNFQEIDLTTQLNMVEVNCKALLLLMHSIGSQMVLSDRGGYILNVASTAAFQPGPTMATYFATKAFVLSLSEAVRFERKSKGVHVTALCPGATKTAFFDRSKVASSAQMVQRMMRSDEVVNQWLAWLFAKKRVVIPWLMNKMLLYIWCIAPRNMVMSIVQKIMAK